MSGVHSTSAPSIRSTSRAVRLASVWVRRHRPQFRVDASTKLVDHLGEHLAMPARAYDDGLEVVRSFNRRDVRGHLNRRAACR
jgi:hypothetical protein